MNEELEAFLGHIKGAAAYDVGVGVVVREFVQRMQFVETLNELLPWDPKQCAVSPGQRILALVIAFIEDRKALYRIEEAYAHRDVELLLGQGVAAEQLNDKALGRALDKLWTADPKRVYSTLCFRAVEAYEVVIDRLHTDTTSVSVEGVYAGPTEGGPQITFGFSKDHRPDLRQIKLGTTVTQEGIPLAGDVFDGNETDQTWNEALLDWLEDWISPEKRQETLFAADSALITSDNLKHLDQGGYRFVSRLPDTFSYATVARSEALYGPAEKWEDIGKLAHEKKASEYQLREVAGEIEERDYRLIVVRSSRLFELKQKTLERKATKEREALERAGRKIGRETFSCREDAETALQTLLDQLAPRFWTAEHYVEDAVIQPPRRRGRPAKTDEPPAGATVYRVHLAPAALDRDAFERECRWQSTFVLISNDSSRTAMELFIAYRGQAAAESEFRWLKSPVHISPVFLKRPTRVAAFGYVMLMAYLVYALVQRAIRNALPEGELLAVEGRKTDHPTAQAVFDVIAHAKVLHVKFPGQSLARIFLTPSAKAARILELLRIPADAFITVPGLNSA